MSCNCNNNLTLFSGLQGNPGNYTVVTAEPAGVNCTNGGVKIELFNGLTNALISTSYACNGVSAGSEYTVPSGDTVYTNIKRFKAKITNSPTTPGDPVTFRVLEDSLGFVSAACSVDGVYNLSFPPNTFPDANNVFFTSHVNVTNLETGQVYLHRFATNIIQVRCFDTIGVLDSSVGLTASILIEVYS